VRRYKIIQKIAIENESDANEKRRKKIGILERCEGIEFKLTRGC
jgi:hypothetical protein